jgi:hypothetical protein
MFRRQVTLHQHDDREWKRCDGNVVFPVLLLKDQPDQLHTEGNPEEHVEFDETFKDLELRIHPLDLAVCSKELVDLPTKFGVDLPTEANVCQFCGGNYTRDDCGEYVYRNVRDSSLYAESASDFADFTNLDDGVYHERQVECSEKSTRVRTSGGAMGGYSRETENLQGIPVVYCIQSHGHLEYAEEVLVITQDWGEKGVDALCKGENSEVNVHFPGCRCRVVALADTRLMKAYQEFAFNPQVDHGLNDHGQYVEPTVQRVREDLDSKSD